MLDVLLKYSVPVTSALPSLSKVGAEDLAPKKRSSNRSYEAAAAFSLASAALAELPALVSDVAALDSDVAALAADL